MKKKGADLVQQNPLPGQSTPFTTDVTDKTNLYSARVTYDVNENLTIGAIGTHGDPEGIRDNTLGGLDVLWRTSRFRGNKNLSVGGWMAASYGDIPSDKNTGWGFKVGYPNDLWAFSLKVKDFGSGLDPALGFMPRPGTRWYSGGIVYKPRPGGGRFDWARQFFFEFFPRYIEGANGRAQSWRIFTAPFNVRTRVRNMRPISCRLLNTSMSRLRLPMV